MSRRVAWKIRAKYWPTDNVQLHMCLDIDVMNFYFPSKFSRRFTSVDANGYDGYTVLDGDQCTFACQTRFI
jgi:hypothetical protein